MYGIEIKLKSTWKAIHPPAGPPPYSFKTSAEAETLARILYPELMRLRREGGEELIRIAPSGVLERGKINSTKPEDVKVA